MHVEEASVRYADWLETVRDISPHTHRAYRTDVRALERYFEPGRLVASITAADLDGFLDGQRRSGLAATSVRRRLAAIRGFFVWPGH